MKKYWYNSRIGQFFIGSIFIFLLFVASFGIVWLVSTDSQNQRAVLFIKQAIKGNNEGLAEYFENLSFKYGMLRLIKPNQYSLELLKSSSFPSLSKYFKMNSKQWYSESHKNKHYALAWSLVYFLTSSKQGKTFLKYMLDHLANNYCKPFSDIEYINKNYPGGISGFEQDWRQWILTGTITEHRY